MSIYLYQLRQEVRDMLRDSTYPEDSIDGAINRVVRDINESGRYRFHEAQYTFNLTANTYTYSIPGNCLGETVMYYALGNNTYQAEIPRKREIFAAAPVVPTDTGNSPTEWASYGNNWYIYPIPNSTAATNGNITVFYDKDLTELLSPMDTLGIPDRHRNVPVYGAVAQLRPNLMLASPKGDVLVSTLYTQAFKDMQTQEHWNMASIPSLRPGPRWTGMNNWGFVSRIR